MRFALRIALAGWLVATAAACVSVQAKTPVEMPLQTPPPPPRVVVPVIVENPPVEPAQPAAAAAPPATAPPHPRDVAPPASTTTSSTATGSPGAPAGRPADKPAAPPEAPAPPTATARELRDKTSTLLKNANEDLGKVVYASLNADLKAQYEQAKRFIAIAQDALNKRSYDYAHDMAEKAANLASQLPKGRRSSLS